MVGDWIKMRSDLYRDPKVSLIADTLFAPDSALARHVQRNCDRDMTVTRNVTRNATVGALLSLWGVMRHQGKRDGDDLVVSLVTHNAIDDLVDLPGFAAAVESVGWLRFDGTTAIFPKFFEENNADPKSKSAARQQRYRDKKRKERAQEQRDLEQKSATSDVTKNVTRDVTHNDREEKSRVENRESEAQRNAPDSNSGFVPTPVTRHEAFNDRTNGYEIPDALGPVRELIKLWQQQRDDRWGAPVGWQTLKTTCEKLLRVQSQSDLGPSAVQWMAERVTEAEWKSWRIEQQAQEYRELKAKLQKTKDRPEYAELAR